MTEHIGVESEVVSVSEQEAGRAASVVARAFNQDPLNLHLYPAEEARRRLAPLMFTAIVRYDCLFGRVDQLADYTAVASWMVPGETVETAERMDEAGFGELPTEVPVERLGAVLERITSEIDRVAPEPHWHLRLLAVEPGSQSGGLGASLLRYGLLRAAATAHPVLLETFAERTIPFYLRNGFETIVTGVEPSSGLRFWALRHR